MSLRRIAPTLMLVLLAVASSGATAASITRGPYLQMLTPSSVLVRWRTDVAVRSEVAYGRRAGELNDRQTSTSATQEHKVQLTGLSADTAYRYRVQESGGGALEGEDDGSFRTAPRRGDSASTRVWILGDSGKGGTGQRRVRDAFIEYSSDRPADLVLMLGDNAYRDGTDRDYQRNMFEIYPDTLSSAPLWPAFGNHDAHAADSRDESGPYFNIFSLPSRGESGGVPSGTEAFYSFDHGNIHFVVLESTRVDTSSNSPMWDWLRADLEGNELPWTVAYWHHPPYSKGSHDSDTSGTQTRMRSYANPILEAHGVDVVLTGHSHAYERSYLLNGHYGNSVTFANSMLVDDGDGDPDSDGPYVKSDPPGSPNDGTVYVVAGASGSLTSGDLDHPAMAVSLASLGSVVMDIDGNTLTASYLDDRGQVLDRFAIVKDRVAGDQTPPDDPDQAPPEPAPGPSRHTVSFEDGRSPTTAYRGTRDAVLSQHRRWENFGTARELAVDGDDPPGEGQDLAILLKWKLTDVPSNAVLESASITVDVTNRSGSRYDLMRMRRYWIESQVTWEQRRRDREWTSGGADGRGDRDNVSLASFTAAGKGPTTVPLNAEGRKLVQRWISGEAANDGFIIARTTSSDGLDFYSREATGAAGRPRLTLTYTVP